MPSHHIRNYGQNKSPGARVEGPGRLRNWLLQKKLAYRLPSVNLIALKTGPALFSVPNNVGLALILVLVVVTVLSFYPKTSIPNQGQVLLMSHEALLYFINGEIMAKELYSDPSARWSHYGLDHDSICLPLGNGIWFARGTVHAQLNGSTVTAPWEVLFFPDNTTSLYTQVGDARSGDLSAALLKAGHPELIRSEAGAHEK